jgi:hypothetical protein
MDYRSYVECDSAAFFKGLSREGELVSARANDLSTETQTCPQSADLCERHRDVPEER